jgi:uncharacterized protein YdhG (YjbR/CyaY superfamily)
MDLFGSSPPLVQENVAMAIRSPLVDAYHARLPAAERKALEQIRAAVHAACPGAEECLSYGMPAVKLEGKPLVGWRAAAKHGAFHPLSGSTVETCKGALADYDTSKGTIRFSFDAVLPAKLVKRLVATRIGEIRQEGKQAGKKVTTPEAKPEKKKATPEKKVPSKAQGKGAAAKPPAVKKKAVVKKPAAKRANEKQGVAKVAARSTDRRHA